MKKLIPLLVLLTTICSANEAKKFVSSSQTPDGSWKAILEVDQQEVDSSYWIPTQEIPLSPKEALEKVLESEMLKAYPAESILFTKCVLWAQHLALRSNLRIGDEEDTSVRIPKDALVTNYRIDVIAGKYSYPFIVLMDGTVISPRIEEK